VKNFLLQFFLSVYLIILSGLLLGCSQPLIIKLISKKPLDPTGLSGLFSLVGYVPLLFYINKNSLKKIFWGGFFSALMHNIIVAYWLFIPIHSMNNVFFCLSCFFVLTFYCVLSMYTAIACFIVKYLFNKLSWPLWITFPSVLCQISFFQNYYLLDGFPWINVGYSIATVPIFLQTVSLVGIYGLIFYIGIVNTIIFNILKTIKKKKYTNNKNSIIIILIITIILIIYGIYRIKKFNHINFTNIRTAILQGNFKQSIKNNSKLYNKEIFFQYRNLQEKALKQGAQLIIWPETAFPTILNYDIKKLKLKILSPQITIFGAIAQAYQKKFKKLIVLNSAFILDHKFNILNRIDKTHLVPFGEYIPWPFNKITKNTKIQKFTKGKKIQSIKIAAKYQKHIKIGISICYEGLFPEISKKLTKNGAILLINLTNDAWFNISSAPYQHLIVYSIRAVENFRYYIRAANTGVSSFVNPVGYIYKPTSLYKKRILISNIKIINKKTYYIFGKNFIVIFSSIFIIVGLLKSIFIRFMKK